MFYWNSLTFFDDPANVGNLISGSSAFSKNSPNIWKLEVVKQEMVRVNIYILGISELKWTGMSEFNSGDHYFYYCGQESLRGNGVAIMVNKRVQNAVLGCNLKNNRMISVPLEPPKIKSDTVSTVSPSISHEVMGPDAMIFIF